MSQLFSVSCVFACVCLNALIKTQNEEVFEVDSLKEMEVEYSKTICQVKLGH